MASKRRCRRKECLSKKAYPDEHSALIALRVRQRCEPAGSRLHHYPCRYGPHWHVGHEPGSARWRFARRGTGQ
ncbi:MAG TPA: hypothetical protein VNP04_21445 [Alphaproteobacteria bacterium]|nr:hypothetical protein [Alphaproteobacteria bacterium]